MEEFTMASRTKLFMLGAFIVATVGVRVLPAADISASDRAFLEDAAKGGMQEVQYGQMATQHGGTAAVETFGHRMVTDHTKVNQELTQLAKQKGVTLPNNNPNEAANSSLANKNGTDF